MAKSFTDRFKSDAPTPEISGSDEYRAFKAGSKKRLSFKITKTDGTIHVIPFCYLLPFKVDADPKTGRTICSFAAGPKVVALMMENFSDNDVARFIDALGEQELETIEEWDRGSNNQAPKEPHFSQIMISEPKLEAD